MNDTIPNKKGSSASSGTYDTRRFRRYGCKHRPMVNLAPNSAQAVLRDVSREGVGLILLQSFEPATIIDIQFQSGKPGVSWTVAAEVRHGVQQPDGSWLVGFHLLRVLTEEELAILQSDFQPHPSSS